MASAEEAKAAYIAKMGEELGTQSDSLRGLVSRLAALVGAKSGEAQGLSV